MLRSGTSADPIVVALRAATEVRQAELDEWIWEGNTIVVAERAAAAIRHNPLHPMRTWVAAAVAPECSPQELVTLLAEARRRADRPLKLRAWTLPHLDALISTGTAVPLIESYVVELDAERADTARWRDASIAHRVEHRSFEVSIGDAAWALYRRIHAWDPVEPGAAAPAGWGDDVIAAVTLDGPDASVAAVGLVHEGEPPEAALIGTTSAARDEARVTSSLLAALLTRCTKLAVEADVGVGAHPALVSALREIPGAIWQEPLRFVEVP